MVLSLLMFVGLLQAPARMPADQFTSATPADLNKYRAVIETDKGKITLEFMAERAPETVRQFLRLATAEVYDTTRVHRVLANMIQTGAPFYRTLPLSVRQTRLIHPLKPEFSKTPFVAGIVGMAHGGDDEPAQTSFFICTTSCHEFDGKYTAFARVVSGLAVAKAISAVPAQDERPKTQVLVIRVTVSKRPGA
jgi:peptidyl-prolyl cis-trans isomerase B (cyclophilin B)